MDFQIKLRIGKVNEVNKNVSMDHPELKKKVVLIISIGQNRLKLYIWHATVYPIIRYKNKEEKFKKIPNNADFCSIKYSKDSLS